MPKTTPNEQLTNFYLDELCRRADDVFRMAYLLTLNEPAALACLDQAYDILADNLAEIAKHDETSLNLLQACWRAYQSLKTQPTPDSSFLAGQLKGLSLEERASLVAVDIAGLAAEEASRALGWELSKLQSQLANARKKLSQCQLEAKPDNLKRNAHS